jgi:hypothetical protein
VLVALNAERPAARVDCCGVVVRGGLHILGDLLFAVVFILFFSCIFAVLWACFLDGDINNYRLITDLNNPFS